MIVKSVLAMILTAGLAAGTVTAAERAAHIMRMDDIDAARYDIEDGAAAKSAEQVQKGTTAVGDLLRAERAYFVRGGAEDATAALDKTVGIVRDIDAAAKAGDFATVSARYADLQASCTTCHDLKADDRIKVEG